MRGGGGGGSGAILLLVQVQAVHSPLFYRVIIDFDRRVREIVILISYSYTWNELMEGAELSISLFLC